MSIDLLFTKKIKKTKPAFTIVELLIVIVVIGILAAISIVAYNGIQARATDSETKSDTSLIGKKIEAENVIRGSYAPELSDYSEMGQIDGGVDTDFIYTSDGESYQLTGYSTKPNTKAYCFSSDSRSVNEGACSGHNIPGADNGGGAGDDVVATDESCFTIQSSGSIVAITSYSDDCTKDVVIPSTVDGTTVTAIGYGAFMSKQLTSVSIPSSITSIGEQAFMSNNLTNVTIGSSVDTIHFGAFAANQLTSLTIPNSVTGIGDSAFAYNQLSSVSLPNSLETISRYAFRENQLSSVTIPTSVSNVGQDIFADNNEVECHVSSSATFNPSTIGCANITTY